MDKTFEYGYKLWKMNSGKFLLK